MVVRIDYYLSRILHQLSSVILGGAAFAPYLYTVTPVFVDKRITAWVGVLSLVTGLYNAGAAKPSRMGEKKNLWRVVIYVLKLSFVLLLTPLLDKIVGSENAVPGRAVIAFLAICSGSWAKFYREKYQVLEPSKLK